MLSKQLITAYCLITAYYMYLLACICLHFCTLSHMLHCVSTFQTIASGVGIKQLRYNIVPVFVIIYHIIIYNSENCILLKGLIALTMIESDCVIYLSSSGSSAHCCPSFCCSSNCCASLIFCKDHKHTPCYQDTL